MSIARCYSEATSAGVRRDHLHLLMKRTSQMGQSNVATSSISMGGGPGAAAGGSDGEPRGTARGGSLLGYSLAVADCWPSLAARYSPTAVKCHPTAESDGFCLTQPGRSVKLSKESRGRPLKISSSSPPPLTGDTQSRSRAGGAPGAAPERSEKGGGVGGGGAGNAVATSATIANVVASSPGRSPSSQMMRPSQPMLGEGSPLSGGSSSFTHSRPGSPFSPAERVHAGFAAAQKSALDPSFTDEDSRCYSRSTVSSSGAQEQGGLRKGSPLTRFLSLSSMVRKPSVHV